MRHGSRMLAALAGVSVGALALAQTLPPPAPVVTFAKVAAGGKVMIVPQPGGPVAMPPGVAAAKAAPAEGGTAGGNEASPAQLLVVGGAGAVPAALAARKKEAEELAAFRLQQIGELKFDRRRAARLDAFAKPELPTPEELAAEKDDKKRAALEFKRFTKWVTLGRWSDVKAYIAGLPPTEAVPAYRAMLAGLARRPNPGEDGQPVQQAGMQYVESNEFALPDVLALIECAPPLVAGDAVTRAGLLGSAAALAGQPGLVGAAESQSLSGILSLAVSSGLVREVVAKGFADAMKRPEFARAITPRQVARLLNQSGFAEYIGAFLPTFEQADAADDLEGLNLLAKHFVALHAEKPDAGHLEAAWRATQRTLAAKEGDRRELEAALKQAVTLASQLEDKLGRRWLEDSFRAEGRRGKDILAALGKAVSGGISQRPYDSSGRAAEWKLAKVAVDALLPATEKEPAAWTGPLTSLAAAWLVEAQFSRVYDRTAGGGPRMRRDFYGNFYYSSGDDSPEPMMMYGQQQNMPRAVPVADLLKAGPDPAWLARVEASVQPKLSAILAQLHLRMNDEERAFPFIESLAPTQPEEAKGLVEQFLRVWTKNHDPNAEKNQYRSSYIYFYGFEQRAEGIPLTRSKQERNLVELAGWTGRLRKLNLGEIDQIALMSAFTTCHSSAEVYKAEAIEKVFGPISGLKPATLAALAQTMRGNLAGLWRMPAVQEKNKTNRKQKDIEIEVARGYQVALETVAAALARFPQAWDLHLSMAALLHDQINFAQELSKSSDFSKNRAITLGLFAEAARLYGKAVAERTVKQADETTQVYDQWFYASLGAVDIGQILEDKVPDDRQPKLIRAAIEALPSDARKRHVDKFANNLFTRLSSVKPQVKFRYLKGAFQIVDTTHPQVDEARKVYDYYADLVREIKLDVKVDGGATVGHGRPFGVMVNLLHTRDIERESGGFSKYLVNQNAMMFAFNYGRPTADYRERFEKGVREALKEQFEVQSVTFQESSVNSRAAAEFGWRYTPYAYLLVKPRGPQVDRVPPLRMDLDFLDTSGFVVLPIESSALPIDCKPAEPEPRPVSELTVTQILDERQAAKGKLLLEVKASAVGLVGGLKDVLDLNPNGFEVKNVEDAGVAVTRFAPDAPNAVISERTWTITLEGPPGQPLPKEFSFGEPKGPVKEATYQRFKDADLVNVQRVTSLEAEYERSGWLQSAWVWGTAAAGGLVLLALAIAALSKPRRAAAGPEVPENLSPFAALSTLNALLADPRLTAAQKLELADVIGMIERAHFGMPEAGATGPDLRAVTVRWLTVVR